MSLLSRTPKLRPINRKCRRSSGPKEHKKYATILSAYTCQFKLKIGRTVAGANAEKPADLQPGGDGPGPGSHHPLLSLRRPEQVLAVGSWQRRAVQDLALAADDARLHGVRHHHHHRRRPLPMHRRPDSDAARPMRRHPGTVQSGKVL